MSFAVRSLLALALFTAVAPVLAQDAAHVRSLFEARDPQAPALIAQLLKSRPDSLDAKILHIRQQLRAGEAEEAVDLAEELVDAHPQSALAQYWLGNAYGNRIGQVGMLSKMMMAPKLRDAYEIAIKLDPELVDARANLVQFYLQAPSTIGGGIDKAKAQQQEIAQRDLARGHVAQAQILMAEEKPAEALKAYEAALAAKPDAKDIRIAVGIGYQEAKRWNDAFALFERWTAENDLEGAAWYQLGRTSALSGQKPEQGVAALQRFLKLPVDPRNPPAQHAWYRMGQILAAAGRRDEARSAYQSALKLDPKHSDAKAELAKL